MVTVLLATIHFLIALLPVVGDIDIARAIHRHAIGIAQSRGDQRGDGTGRRDVGGTGLGDGERLAGNGERAGARDARVGIVTEHHIRAARAALVRRAQMQPRVVGRSSPGVSWVSHSQHDAITARSRSFQRRGRAQRGLSGGCKREAG